MMVYGNGHTGMAVDRPARCIYGCCCATGPKGRRHERRWLKRGERQRWKNELKGEQ